MWLISFRFQLYVSIMAKRMIDAIALRPKAASNPQGVASLEPARIRQAASNRQEGTTRIVSRPAILTDVKAFGHPLKPPTCLGPSSARSAPPTPRSATRSPPSPGSLSPGAQGYTITGTAHTLATQPPSAARSTTATGPGTGDVAHTLNMLAKMMASMMKTVNGIRHEL